MLILASGMTLVIEKGRGCAHTVNCSIARWALTMHGLSWDKNDHRFAHFPNQQHVFIPLLLFSQVLYFTLILSVPLHCPSLYILHFSSFFVHLCHAFLTHTFIAHFFLHFYSFPLTLIPHTVPSAPSSHLLLHHIFPPFHTISLPFSPPQAVWDVSSVCRPAGPDPHMLQRERWKNPALLQHSSPLPTVCQQCQTGAYLLKLSSFFYHFSDLIST